MASMVEPCRCGHTAWEACSYKQVFLICNIFLIIQLSIQQGGEHSFLAQFREYTCFFFNAKI